ncbi:NAD-dependent epimerase/dehydratase family protein [Methylomonas koyamae]|uniref:NAD-dependent epimerase/dehydratase family protein n=1 Tax=Methylomonas koyamae TaxID=702114 RepID=UPI0006D03079|nr:NAD(P)-dependent oxidoreductase [Methylomonas koyamae]BBL57687.1 CDP-4-dehydro-6-deoxy-D-gulose 4-reductase [Methylomonas koyamae]
MRIAVTGADGFIGRYLLPILLAQGHQVAAVSRRAGHPPQPGLSWLQADLLDAGQVRQAMAEAEAECLIHLAWFVEHGRFWTAAENFAWCDATAGLLAAFNEFGGKRAVLAGTCAEYDWNYGYCIEGKTPTVPATLYGKCKDAARQFAEHFCRDNGIEWVWGRIFTPYGPGEPVGRFVPSVLSAMGRGEVLKCSHGRQFRDFLHASDVAAAFAHLAANTPATGVFNIASGEPMRLADIVAICAGLFEAEPAVEFGAVPVAEYDPLMLVGCADKLAATGWAARISIRDGLADYRIKINELKGSE